MTVLLNTRPTFVATARRAHRVWHRGGLDGLLVLRIVLRPKLALATGRLVGLQRSPTLKTKAPLGDRFQIRPLPEHESVVLWCESRWLEHEHDVPARESS